jgi:mannose-6-phosphate isomerase-like protein (cupin superfamily)
MRESIRITAFLLSSAACASALAAQSQQRPAIPTDADTLVTAEEFQSILKNGPVADGKPGNLSTQLFGRVGNAAFIRIVAPDTPHAHGGTSEIYVIQSGRASIETGGDMVGPFNGNSAVHQGAFVNADGSARAPGTQAAGQPPMPPAGGAAPAGNNGGGQGGRAGAGPGGPHDGSGTAVAGGRIQVVKAGDVILVPAGVPHHWVKVDEPVVYLDIKYPKPKE